MIKGCEMLWSFVSYSVGHFPSISLFLERTCVCKLLSAMLYTSSFYHICWLCCCFSTYLVIFLSFDLSVPEMGICIKSFIMVVNLTVTFVNFIKTSFQWNESQEFPGTPVVRTFVAMALGPILVGELRSGKLCIAAKKKRKKWVCVCVCVCVWKGKTFYWINY